MDEPSSSGPRRAPRFISKAAVEVSIASRAELQTLYSHDISKGGLFVVTDDPPPLRTSVSVTLATDDGQLGLKAEVVHVVDPVQAAQRNHPAGVGLQFIDLTPELRTRIQSYVDGLAARLSASDNVIATSSVAERMDRARNFLASLDRGEIYAALGVEPAATDATIRMKVATLDAALADEGGASPPQAARLQSARRALERLARVIYTPSWRREHDLMSGNVRAGERLAQAGTVPEREALKKLWARLHPDKVSAAAPLVAKALQAKEAGDHAGALKLGAEALELEPFHVELREALRVSFTKVNGARIVTASKHASEALAAVEAGDLEKAIAAGNKALELDPYNLELGTAVAEWSAQRDVAAARSRR